MKKAAVIVFPGSNCDRDIRVALEGVGYDVDMVWHASHDLPKVDLIVIPGGFSYGDYLRSGAISAHSPIMREVKEFAENGGYVLGICNGFQVLAETHLVPGTLMRNRDLNFICKDVFLKVADNDSAFTSEYEAEQVIKIPVAHHDGNFFLQEAELKALEDNGQVAFRYCDESGAVNDNSNPNGSLNNIAGVFNEKKNVLGMMPHPERVWEDALGGEDGKKLFESLLKEIGN